MLGVPSWSLFLNKTNLQLCLETTGRTGKKKRRGEDNGSRSDKGGREKIRGKNKRSR